MAMHLRASITMVSEQDGGDNIAARIRKKLVVDESAIFDAILERSSKLIALSDTGSVHLVAKGPLKGSDSVALFLIGKNLAKNAKLAQGDTAGPDDVANGTGLMRDVAIARLNELKKKGDVEVPSRGLYRIVPARIRSILDRIDAGG